MALLEYFELYEDDLKYADDIVESICSKYGIDYECVMYEVRNDFWNAFMKEPTEWIIERMFERLAESLGSNCGISRGRISYDTSCTNFHIDKQVN